MYKDRGCGKTEKVRDRKIKAKMLGLTAMTDTRFKPVSRS